MISGEFLKVYSFLNHKVNRAIMKSIGMALAKATGKFSPTKIVTVEAGGNIPAYKTAENLNVELVYAKKGQAVTMSEPETTKVKSPTKAGVTDICLSGKYIKGNDKVLIVDDFLFTGETSKAVGNLIKQKGAKVVGYAYAICKKEADG